jgi:hypothetical protein
MIWPKDIFQASEAAAVGIKAGQWFEAKVRSSVRMATFAASWGSSQACCTSLATTRRLAWSPWSALPWSSAHC